MTSSSITIVPPDQTDVDTLRGLLDLLGGFVDNDQRARYLLSSNWLRDRGPAAAARLTPPRTGTPVVPVLPVELEQELARMREEMLDPSMPPCPSWCTLQAGHPWDGGQADGRFRGHRGLRFGYVETGSVEYAAAVGVQVYDACVSELVEDEVTTADDARALAADLLTAAAWMDACAGVTR